MGQLMDFRVLYGIYIFNVHVTWNWRGFDRGSVIMGALVNNQWIERLCRDVFWAVTFSYYKLFYDLEYLQLLNHLHGCIALCFTCDLYTNDQCLFGNLLTGLESACYISWKQLYGCYC